MSTFFRCLTKALFAALCLASLAACGPIYDTRYSFTPPSTPQGQSCLFHCSQLQDQCEQLEDHRQELCEERARYERERCERDLRRDGKKVKWYDCGTESCTSDYDRCAQQYRSCYESCGGKVSAEQVCVMNCDQVRR